MKIPIAKLGEIQKIDIERSSGSRIHNGLSRICTVIKAKTSPDNRQDNVPFRMEDLFGGHWNSYNNHYIIQVAGCPLKCHYCYVDNLAPNKKMDASEIVEDFSRMKSRAQKSGLDVNVLHLMGGAPAKYPSFWKELRQTMDINNHNNILFSDVILVENHFYGVKPWEYLNMDNFILTGCLKGTNRENFKQNTGKDLFDVALGELENYSQAKNFYLTLINHNEKEIERIYNIFPKEKVDFLTVVDYEVTKSRRTK